MKYAISLIILILISTVSFSINVDSLKIELERSTSDSLKLKYSYAIHYIYYMQSKFSESLLYGESCLDISLKSNKLQTAISVYNNFAVIYSKLKNYEESIEYYLKALEIAEKNQHIHWITMLSNNIAILYFDIEMYEESIKYYKSCLENTENIDSLWLTDIYLETGKGYLQINQLDSSKLYAQKAYKNAQIINDTLRVVESLNLIGNVLVNEYETNSSDTLFTKAKMLFVSSELLNNYKFENELSETYFGLGKLEFLNNNFSLARSKFQKAYELSRNNEINNYLSQVYFKIGNTNRAFAYLNEYYRLKDSINEENKAELVNQKINQYHFDNQIQNLKYVQREKEIVYEKERQQDKQQKFFLSLIIMFVLFFAIYAYKSFLRKKKDNILLVEQKEEINAQRDSILEQKQEIENVHGEIEASINYAERIQRSILPEPSELRNVLSEYFILFKPRDIVSGDFYWFKKVRNYLVITAADCTGHGVPGAFMSILGVSFLNELVNNSQVDSSDIILNRLREKVKKALKQKGEIGENKDGMDMALCVINLDTKEVQYSGAYNPLYIIRKSEFIQIKADRQPIAVYEAEKPFTQNKYQLEKGDCLYMFSDGYSDQFGGANNKKFMTKRLKQILIENYHKPLEEQKMILDAKFTEWKKGYDQMDDVIIIGLKI